MKAERNFNLVLLFLINICSFAIVFVKTHFNRLRNTRLKGFKIKATSKATAVAHNAKNWCYAMYSRWHVDRCELSFS